MGLPSDMQSFDNMDNISYSTVSRSNGWALEKAEEQHRLAEYFVENKYDIFINNSALWKSSNDYEQVYNKCKDAGHSAYLIHMGSTVHTGVKGRTWRYPTESTKRL